VDDILARVRSGEVLLADGATGTLAIERGWADPACPEAMNLSHPERCEQIAREYRDAGALVLKPNTFGAPLARRHRRRPGRRDQPPRSRRPSPAAGAAFVAGSCGLRDAALRRTQPATRSPREPSIRRAHRSGRDAIARR
jgi:hypothetical protein